MPTKKTTAPATSSSGRTARIAQARANPPRSLTVRTPPPRLSRVATSSDAAAKVAASARYSGRGSARWARATPATAKPSAWPRVIAPSRTALAWPTSPPPTSRGTEACLAGVTSASTIPSRYSAGYRPRTDQRVSSGSEATRPQRASSSRTTSRRRSARSARAARGRPTVRTASICAAYAPAIDSGERVAPYSSTSDTVRLSGSPAEETRTAAASLARRRLWRSSASARRPAAAAARAGSLCSASAQSIQLRGFGVIAAPPSACWNSGTRSLSRPKRGCWTSSLHLLSCVRGWGIRQDARVVRGRGRLSGWQELEAGVVLRSRGAGRAQALELVRVGLQADPDHTAAGHVQADHREQPPVGPVPVGQAEGAVDQHPVRRHAGRDHPQ